jgi:two-component system phosphate regulon sensor histidine kinase PhoR
MKEWNFKIVVISAALAIAGLIGAQIYWINNAISVEEREFVRKANYAIMNAAEKIERIEMTEVFKKIIKEKFPNDTALTNMPFFRGGNAKFKRRFENIELDGRDDHDSLMPPPHRIIEEPMRKPVRILGKAIDSVYLKKSEVISQVMNEFMIAISQVPMEERIKNLSFDSVLSDELKNFGIDAEYYYGVAKGKPLKFIVEKPGSDKEALIDSRFRTPLFPFEILGEPNFLVVYFPEQQAYAVKSISFTLGVSAILIIIVIGVFAQLVNAALKQKKIAEVKNDLINNITHEFKTPISAISLAHEMLTEPTFNLDKKSSDKYLKAIDDENKKLKKMVETLLNAAAMEKGEQKLNKTRFDLKEVVQKTAGTYENIIESRHGVYHVDFLGDDFIIEADQFHISNTINNLLDNAVKYSAGTPIINVIVKDEGPGVTVSVEDNGIGISKKDIKHIFEAFYRAQKGNVHNVKGYGIGLSYARQTAEEHGGSLKARSKPGIGSVFELYLPKTYNGKWKIK